MERKGNLEELLVDNVSIKILAEKIQCIKKGKIKLGIKDKSRHTWKCRAEFLLKLCNLQH